MLTSEIVEETNKGCFVNKQALRQLVTVITVLPLLLFTGSVVAHHANSAYDRTKEISITGAVTKWQFINPHSGIWLDVEESPDNTLEWSGEFQGTLDLYRHFQWNKNTFKRGDIVTLIGYPARNGSATISTRKVVFANGQEINVRGAPD